jgi:cytochrome c oxidase subunit 2
MRKLALLLPWLILATFLFSGCSYFDSPQNVFAPAGDVSRDQKNLFFLTMWPALAVLIFVEVACVYICIRYRARKGDTGLPKQVHGNNKLEIGWTVAPMLLLGAFVPLVIGGIVDLGRTPKDAMPVDVTGIQWAWQFAYPDAAGGPPTQAPIGELHIPVNKNIAINLHALDVIHSFWVPKLAGKTDAIPGRTNHMWLNATETGEFHGQCAEFCGLGHAGMRFTVCVQSQRNFDTWLEEQKNPPAEGQEDPGAATCT